jgi:ankyrin repeat protein
VLARAPFSREEYLAACELLAVDKARPGGGGPEDDGDDAPLVPNTPYFLDWETRMGGTALILASVEADVALLETVVAREAVLDHENRLGHTALTWAAVCGHDEVRDSQRKDRLIAETGRPTHGTVNSVVIGGGAADKAGG